MYRGRERDINFKELVYMIVEAGKSKICRAGHQAGDLKELQFECEGNLLQNSQKISWVYGGIYTAFHSQNGSQHICVPFYSGNDI